MKAAPYFLDGAYLAVNVASDFIALVDAQRCEMERSLKIARMNDNTSNLLGRGAYDDAKRVYTLDWSKTDEFSGTEAQMEKELLRLSQLHPDKTILLFAGFLSLVINTDIEGVAKQMRKKLTNPMRVVRQDSIDEDWLSAWCKTETAILQDRFFREGDPKGAFVVGYPVMRTEGDEIGSMAEILKIFELLGLPEPLWPMNPEQRLRLQNERQSGYRKKERRLQLTFPYASEASIVSFAEIVPLPIPIGPKRIRQFFERVGEAFGVSEKALSLCQEQAQDAYRKLETFAVSRFTGKTVAIAADPERLLGLSDAARALGFDVVLAISLSFEKTHEKELQALFKSGVRVLDNPNFTTMKGILKEYAQNGEIDLALGSGLLFDVAKEEGLAFVETGFPTYFEHFLTPAPFTGFQGMLRLAERIDNALRVAHSR